MGYQGISYLPYLLISKLLTCTADKLLTLVHILGLLDEHDKL
jgi:hypothetical protein